MGICILGMGDCNTRNEGFCMIGIGDCTPTITNTVKNVSTTLNENIKQTMMSLTAQAAVFGKATQNYQMGNIVGNGCSMNFAPIRQDLQVTTNFSQMAKVVTEQTYNQSMASAINNAVKSDTTATTGFMSAGANVNNTTENYNTNINKVLNSYSYSSFQSLMQQMQASQHVGFGNIVMNCPPGTPVDPTCGAHLCMGGVTQNMVITMIASQISDTMSKTIEQVLQQSQIASQATSTTTVKATGMFQDIGTALTGVIGAAGSAIGMMFAVPIMIGVGLIILLVVIVLVFRYAFSGSQPSAETQPGMEMQPGMEPGMEPGTEMPQGDQPQEPGTEMQQDDQPAPEESLVQDTNVPPTQSAPQGP